MSIAAIINAQGYVANLILLNDGDDPALYGAIACDETPQIGWSYDGSQFTAPVVTPPEPEPTPVPFSVTDRQFAQALAEAPYQVITWPQARAWGARGEVPATLMAQVNLIPDEITRERALMFLESATTFERNHPMTVMFGTMMGWPSEDLDDLWIFASTL